ncbi:uncharacterized protein VNE69_07269 [Vairimorpha necatrix]|uniref:Uncharacterized protein n=1 Tax=Vairimorpha necatrix TaxID=6039 RepID=A0AAX4JDW0_9MICR
MKSLDQKYNKYKQLFTRYINQEDIKNNSKDDYKHHLNIMYTEIIEELQIKYKNTAALLNSTLIFYIFLHPEKELLKKSTNEIKKVFFLNSILENTKLSEKDTLDTAIEEYSTEIHSERNEIYNFVNITTNVNLLEYHPLVLKYQESKNKIIKIILNKLVLALKMDICKSEQFLDFYKSIEEGLNKKPVQRKSLQIQKKTKRGGVKKKIKILKQLGKN